MSIGSTWTDRRPIGRIIFAQIGNDSASNLNGWNNTGPVNLRDISVSEQYYITSKYFYFQHFVYRRSRYNYLGYNRKR